MDWKSNKQVIINEEPIEIGNTVTFERRGRILEGLIILIRENSVIVELKQEAIEFLGLENDRTVVRHNNYKVV